MIEFLRGTIVHRDEDHAVVETGGVGYGLDLPVPALARLGAVGDEAELWVYTHVAEGSLQLYGFTTRHDREIFEIFLGISGVGPRLGLALLSTFSGPELVQIVLRGDAGALKAVPGVGLKKAEKLMLELKGRIERLGAGASPSARPGGRGAAIMTLPSPAGPLAEAVAALESLEVNPAVARRAIQKAAEKLGEGAPVEELVREGLRHRHAV